MRRFRSRSVVLPALCAGWLVSSAVAQPTEQCGPKAPALKLGVPLAGTNYGAATHAIISDNLCGGFQGSGGELDVFVRFIPPATGSYRFTTCGSPTDTIVSVHSACPVNDSNLIGCNDDECDSQASEIDVSLVGGVQYHIRIAGSVFTGGGDFEIVVTSIPSVSNDECDDAIAITPNSSTPGTNVNATGASLASCITDGKDVWYSLPITTSGVCTIDTAGSTHEDTVVTIFDGCGGSQIGCNDNDGFNHYSRVVLPLNAGNTYLVRVAGRRGFTGQPSEGEFVLNVSSPQIALPNDDCSTATIISAPSVTSGTTLGAATGGLETSCADNELYDVWYSLTVPTRAEYVVSVTPAKGFDSSLAIFDFCGGNELACNNNFGGDSVTITLDANIPYLVRVSASFHAQGDFTLEVDAGTPIPANDLCDNAIAIGVGGVIGTNRAATGQDETPMCAYADTGDVWYVFTAPEDGLYTFDTSLSTDLTDTSIALYETCGGAPILCNDNIAPQADKPIFTSLVNYPMTTGQRVLVRVAGFFGAVGEFQLFASGPSLIEPPPVNTACEGAIVITGNSFTDQTDARNAGIDFDTECNFLEVTQTHYGVWYTYTAPESGFFLFREIGPVYASVGGYRGNCNNLNYIYDQCGEISAEVDAGATYSFLVGSEGVEYPAVPYEVDFTFRPQLGCCTTSNGCELTAQTACDGKWIESLCGPSASYTGGSNLPLTIPNPQSNGNPVFVSSSITVPDAGVVSNVSVSVTISHNNGADVWLRLTAPNGEQVDLHASNGGLSLAGTYQFSDIGLLSIAEMTNLDPQPQRTYPGAEPIGPAVEGSSVAGVWTLSVGDDRRSGPVGELLDWSITIHTACDGGCPADFNADTVVNSQDFFDFLNAFFESEPSADFNNDEAINSQDFFDFLGAFFKGC